MTIEADSTSQNEAGERETFIAAKERSGRTAALKEWVRNSWLLHRGRQYQRAKMPTGTGRDRL